MWKVSKVQYKTRLINIVPCLTKELFIMECRTSAYSMVPTCLKHNNIMYLDPSQKFNNLACNQSSGSRGGWILTIMVVSRPAYFICMEIVQFKGHVMNFFVLSNILLFYSVCTKITTEIDRMFGLEYLRYAILNIDKKIISLLAVIFSRFIDQLERSI